MRTVLLSVELREALLEKHVAWVQLELLVQDGSCVVVEAARRKEVRLVEGLLELAGGP
jgi:hypothetical protein